MRRVLILDGAVFPDIYQPADHWRRFLGDVPADAVQLPQGQPVPDLGRYTHVIVTGSEASIVEPAPWYEVEAEAVRRAAAAGLAILGSCFGHQMLALALDGPQAVRRSPTPEVGWLPVEVVADDPLLVDLPRPFWTFCSHFDEVVGPPAPWRVLARTPDCAVHVMRRGEAPIWGIQAHPEIDPPLGRMLLEGFLRHAPRFAAKVRPALEQAPRDDGTAAAIVRRFLGEGG